MAALDTSMPFLDMKIVERRTFLELQVDDEYDELATVGRRSRAFTDSVIEMQCGNMSRKELSDIGSCGSTCDSLGTRSICSDDSDDHAPSPTVSTPPMSSPRALETNCEGTEVWQAPHIVDMNAASAFQDGVSVQCVLAPSSPMLMATPMMAYGMLMAPVVLPCFAQPWGMMPCPQPHAGDVHSSAVQARQSVDSFPAALESATEAGIEDNQQLTTVILRNLPEGCMLSTVLETLDREGFSGSYNFVHVPVDFSSKTSLRYALINMVDAASSAFLVQQEVDCAFFGEECSVGWSTSLQGLEAHIERYRNSPVMHASVPQEFKPALFINGCQVAFPAPTVRVKAPRIRHQKPFTHDTSVQS